MGGPLIDCSSNPLGAVNILFDRAVTVATSPDELGKGDWGVQDFFKKKLIDDGYLAHVPEINSVKLDLLPPKSLVRYRGMVQDMHNVEFYVGAFKDGNCWKTTKYTDMADVPLESQRDYKVWDRRLLYCVPVPGETSWAREAHVSSACPPATAAVSGEAPGDHGIKRQRHSIGIDGCDDPDVTAMGSSTSLEEAELQHKRQREEGGILAPDEAETLGFDPHFPLGSSNLLPCLVKVYDSSDVTLKLNDVVEFIGILTFDPEISAATMNVRDDPMDGGASLLADEEGMSAKLPASRVPRLHCIFLRKLSGRHPLLHTVEAEASARSVLQPSIGRLRESLLNSLVKVLGGDKIAAEFLLLHLISRVHSRVEPMALGKLSLNLINLEGKSDGKTWKHLQSALQELLPRAHVLSLSLDNLNRAALAPHKNYDTNRLATGPLQLAEATHLTIDETALSPGQLTSMGVQNVAALKHLLDWQKVEYDFRFYKMEMPADIPVLILSQAKSRLLPADVAVPVQPVAESFSFTSTSQDLGNWRLFLSLVKHMEHSISPGMQKTLEAELVAARQADRSLGPETFHRWLTMSRLMSLSYGECSLKMEHWQNVRRLESASAARLRVC